MTTCTMTTTIRASSTPMALACPPSMRPTEAGYRPEGDDGALGSACHEGLASAVLGMPPDLNAIAARHGVDADEVASGVRRGMWVWDQQVRLWFPGDLLTEVPGKMRLGDAFPAVELRGTADVVGGAWAGETAVEHSMTGLAVADWKTGRDPSPHDEQLTAYACLARRRHGMPSNGIIYTAEVWIWAGTIRVQHLDTAALDAFESRLVDAYTLSVKDTFSPGSACRWCPHQNSCQARADWLRAGASALAPLEGSAVAIDRDWVAANYGRLGELEKAIKHAKKVARLQVEEGGPIDLEGGGRLELVEGSREKVSAPDAIKLLREQLGYDDEQIAAAVKVSKSGIEAAAKMRAAKSRGAAEGRRAMALLREAGAIDKKTTHTLRISKG
jgi:hypothetical protein